MPLTAAKGSGDRSIAVRATVSLRTGRGQHGDILLIRTNEGQIMFGAHVDAKTTAGYLCHLLHVAFTRKHNGQTWDNNKPPPFG